MPHLAAPAAFVSLALAPLVVGLAGCPTAADQLAKTVGYPPDSVTCPEDGGPSFDGRIVGLTCPLTS